MPVRAAGRDARSAVLAIGPHQLPQSPHLSGRCCAAPRPANVPLRASSARACCFWVPPRASASRPSCSSRPRAASRVFRRTPNTGGGRSRNGNPCRTAQAIEPEGNDAPVHVEADSLPREADRLLLARFAPACRAGQPGPDDPAVSRTHRPVSRARRRPAKLRPPTRHSSGAAGPRSFLRSGRPVQTGVVFPP